MTACPDDETLATLLEDRLDAPTREAVERHVAACPSCLDVVAAALPARAAPAGPRRVPLPAAGLAAAAGLALVVGTGLGYLGARTALERTGDVVAAAVGEALGVPLAVGGAGVSVTRDLRTVRLRLRAVELGPGARADAIEVALAASSLTAERPTIERLRLERPELRIAVAAEPLGGAGWTRLLAGPPVELVDAVLIVDLGPDGTLRLEGVSGTVLPSAAGAAVALVGRAAGAVVGVRGTIEREPRPRFALTIGGEGLAAEALPAVGARGRGRLDLTLTVRGPLAAPRVAGRARLSGASLTGWNPLAGAAVTADDPGAAAAIGALGRRDLAVDTLELAFTARPGAWRVTRARLVHGASVTSLTLARGPGGRLAGRGTIGVADAAAGAVRFVVGGTTAAPTITARPTGEG